MSIIAQLARIVFQPLDMMAIILLWDGYYGQAWASVETSVL